MINLSIVLTTYNDIENFKLTFHSFINQLSYDDEVIVVDSSDCNSVSEFLNDYKFVKYYYQDPIGVFPAMNLGIIKSTNTYIQIMCSGDLILQNTINKVKNSIFKNDSYKIFVFSQIYKFDNNTSYTINPSMNTLFPHQSVICHCSIYQQSLYPEIYKLAADQIFFAEIRKKYDIYFERIKFTSYDMNGLSRKVSLKNSKDIFLIYKKLDRNNFNAFIYAYFLPYSRKFLEFVLGKRFSFLIGFYIKKIFITEFDYNNKR